MSITNQEATHCVVVSVPSQHPVLERTEPVARSVLDVGDGVSHPYKTL